MVLLVKTLVTKIKRKLKRLTIILPTYYCAVPPLFILISPVHQGKQAVQRRGQCTAQANDYYDGHRKNYESRNDDAGSLVCLGLPILPKCPIWAARVQVHSVQDRAVHEQVLTAAIRQWPALLHTAAGANNAINEGVSDNNNEERKKKKRVEMISCHINPTKHKFQSMKVTY